jgi:hypothetical protein
MVAQVLRQTAFLGLALSTALVGGIRPAHADAYAFSENLLSDFQVLVDSGSVTVTSANRNTINTANYAGFSGTSFADPTTIPAGSDAAQATSGPGPFPGQNNFTVGAGAALGMIGTRADSFTSIGNDFVANGGSVTPSGGTGVPVVDNVTEGRATGSSTGNSDAQNTATARLTITVSTGTRLQFSFDDAIALMASTTNPGESAIAALANTFTVQNAAGDVVFEFTPAGDGGGLLDPFNINGGLSSDSGSPSSPINLSGAFLSDISASLSAGTYTVSLRSGSTENIVAAPPAPVPEPAGLQVLGIGLVALGLASRLTNRSKF